TSIRTERGDEMTVDETMSINAPVSEYIHVDNFLETSLHEFAFPSLKSEKGLWRFHTIFLPIQGNHLNSLLPKHNRIKVVACDPSKTRIHSHQIFQIMF